MFEFDAAAREAIGFTFILRQLAPASPYGAKKIKALAFLDRAALEVAFDNIHTAMAYGQETERLTVLLSPFKDIYGSLAKKTFTQVDIFEIKQFLLAHEKLRYAIKEFSFKGLDLCPMEAPLAIVDPKGLGIAAYTVESPLLDTLREEKRRAEASGPMSEARYALVQREYEEENRVLQALTDALRPYIPLFYANMDTIGALDLTLAKARLALQYPTVRPAISDNGTLSFTDMYNPYVADALREQPMTPVSLSMEKGVTVITGANMGGKSVAIKTAVLNTLLCRLGFYAFARAARVPLFDGICLISEDAQDVRRGLSGFGAEMTRLDGIVRRLRGEFLFIALDEFARGTNPDEGAAIVRGVAAYLHKSGCVCLLATHYNKVVRPAFAHYQVKGLTFAAQGAAYMDYTLQKAPYDAPVPKDALRICKHIGIEETLLETINNEYTTGGCP